MTLEELYTKHRVLTDGLERHYVIDAHERRFDLDYVTPMELILLVPDYWTDEKNTEPMDREMSKVCPFICTPRVKRFCYRAWVQLLKDLINYLQNNAPRTKEELLSFKTDWSDAPIFSETKTITNMIEMDNGLYFSVNYTATHSAWIIGDLLEFYDCPHGTLILHRTPISEPKEIVDELTRIRKESFKDCLISDYGLSEDKADKVLNGVETLNKVLVKMGTSYNSFWLFDSSLTLSNYKAKVLSNDYLRAHWSEGQFKTAKKYLDYLTSFYNKLHKEAKKHKRDLVYTINIM